LPFQTATTSANITIPSYFARWQHRSSCFPFGLLFQPCKSFKGHTWSVSKAQSSSRSSRTCCEAASNFVLGLQQRTSILKHIISRWRRPRYHPSRISESPLSLRLWLSVTSHPSTHPVLSFLVRHLPWRSSKQLSKLPLGCCPSPSVLHLRNLTILQLVKPPMLTMRLLKSVRLPRSVQPIHCPQLELIMFYRSMVVLFKA